MKATYLNRHGDASAVEYGDLSEPRLLAGAVKVKVKAVSINHLDIWIRKGMPQLKLPFPHVLGSDAAGVVEAVGEGVTAFNVGDEVIVHPGLSCGRCEFCLTGEESLCRHYKILGEQVSGLGAELVVVPERNLFLKPKSVSFIEAASIPLVFTTAWHMVFRRGEVGPGTTVLIHAAGSGVSSAAIQMVRLAGGTVIATGGDEKKRALAERLGAHYALDSKSAELAKQVKQLCPRGVDVILDHVGQGTWETNFKVVRWGGKIVTCGATSGFAVNLDLRQIFFRQVQLLGSTMGSKGDFARQLELVTNGKLKPVVAATYPFAEVREAHKFLESRQALGKIVLTP